MDSKSKATDYIVNSGKACITCKLLDFIYDKVDKNQAHRIGSIQQDLSTPEVKGQIELVEDQGI